MKESPPNRSKSLSIIGSVQSESLQFLESTLSASGYRVQSLVLLTQAEYRRGHSGGFARRLILRFQLTIGFALWLVFVLFKKHTHGVLVVTTNPFFAPLLVALLARARRLPVIQLLYDLYPDALEATAPRAFRMPLRAIGYLTRLTQRNVHGTVYLGPFLKRHTEGRWGSAKHSAVIDVGCDSDLFSFTAASPEDLPLSSPFEIHLGGQLGHMHDVPGAARALRFAFKHYPSLRDDYFLRCYASGPYLPHLAKICSSLPFTILPPTPLWPQVVANATLGFISLSPHGASVCLPSRLYSMMAGGLAIIAICPLWSDLAALIIKAEAGWVINNSPYSTEQELSAASLPGPAYEERLRQVRSEEEVGTDLGSLLFRLSKNVEEIGLRRENARSFSKNSFSSPPLAKKWADFLSEV